MDSVRFLSMFGFICSGFQNAWLEKCVVIYERQCSGCTVDFVEKLWENLWGSRWENGGKKCGKKQDAVILCDLCGIYDFFRSCGGKICRGICTWFYLCKIVVLHNFHRVYYYDY